MEPLLESSLQELAQLRTALRDLRQIMGQPAQWAGGAPPAAVDAAAATLFDTADSLEARLAQHARTLSDAADALREGERASRLLIDSIPGLVALLTAAGEVEFVNRHILEYTGQTLELAHVARVTTLSTLTASIAHEVNQPLSGIMTNVATCLRMLDAAPPNLDGARETVRRTMRDGQRAADVIARLRALFSKREFTLESLDLNDAIREVVAMSLSELQRNRIMVDLALAELLRPAIGDRVQLQQVLLNLIRNASDAMTDVHDRPRQLTIRATQEPGPRVNVAVRDTGIGIDAAHLRRLFDAFHTTKGDGMGIGLSISRSIIERHHGHLWVELHDGPGVTFSFSIPCDEATDTLTTGDA